SDHAAALQPKLSKLTVAVPKGTPGLEVKLDGRPMDAGAYGVAVPVDAGKHALEATAPGHTPFTTEVTVGADADQKSVDVPELPLAPTPPQPAPDETSHALGGRRIAAIAVAGAGVIAIGFGAYFGAT